MLHFLRREPKEISNPREDDTSIGNILRAMGSITCSDLETLVCEQARDPNSKLGEIAVKTGMCVQSDIDHAVDIQSKIRVDGSNKLKVYAEIHRCNIEKNREVFEKRRVANNSIETTLEEMTLEKAG